MRITAAVAALALATSGCATCAIVTVASLDPHSHDDDGPLLVTGTLIDGIAMTSLGAGALDGHSSVGWSRGEGEWAMAGGITLLAIDALIIAVEVVHEVHDHEAPAARAPRRASPPIPPPPVEAPRIARQCVGASVTELAGLDVEIVFQKASRPMPQVRESVGELKESGRIDGRPALCTGPDLLEPGDYRACAIYTTRSFEDDHDRLPAEALSCTTLHVDDEHHWVTIPPP